MDFQPVRGDVAPTVEGVLARPAPRQSSARFRLKAATAEAHERLDRIYSAFDLRRREDYGCFLRSLAVAFVPVEAALAAGGIARLVSGWSATVRSDALRRDLDDLSLALPPFALSPAFSTVPELLGALYVLEGSRLGGTMLARSVAPGLPFRFLASTNASGWRDLTKLIDERLRDVADLRAAARSAAAVFDLFEHAARTAAGTRAS
ncbi:MAG: biliverdin-producing heme oxygenase [Sphingomicrobium sp.]